MTHKNEKQALGVAAFGPWRVTVPDRGLRNQMNRIAEIDGAKHPKKEVTDVPTVEL